MFRTLSQDIIQPNSKIFRTLCNACICRNLAYFRKFTNIQNSDIFKTRHNSEPSQRFKMEFFAKIIKNYNYFSKGLHLRSLTVFWIRLSFNKNSESDLALLYDKYSEPCLLSKIQTYSGLFTFYSDIVSQSYCGIFRTLCNSFIFRTLPYSESWHI